MYSRLPSATVSEPCGCGGACGGHATLAVLGAVPPSGGFSPTEPASESQWIERAWNWARAIVGPRLPDCRDPFGDPEVSSPCPGEIPPARMREIWTNAPLPARAELWGRALANNPQWRCAAPGSVLSDPRTGVVVMRAAYGGRDCRMSNDRGRLRPAFDDFVAQWGDGPGEPGWIDRNILEPIGAGFADRGLEQLVPFVVAGAAIFLLTRGAR